MPHTIKIRNKEDLRAIDQQALVKAGRQVAMRLWEMK